MFEKVGQPLTCHFKLLGGGGGGHIVYIYINELHHVIPACVCGTFSAAMPDTQTQCICTHTITTGTSNNTTSKVC